MVTDAKKLIFTKVYAFQHIVGQGQIKNNFRHSKLINKVRWKVLKLQKYALGKNYDNLIIQKYDHHKL